MDSTSERLFKITAFFIIIYALLLIGSSIISAFNTYYNLDNPLIPDYLLYYAIFPLVFIIPIFGFSIWYCWKSLFKSQINKSILLLLLAICIFHFAFPDLVYDFIHKFNPYGT